MLMPLRRDNGKPKWTCIIGKHQYGEGVHQTNVWNARGGMSDTPWGRTIKICKICEYVHATPDNEYMPLSFMIDPVNWPPLPTANYIENSSGEKQ
jgi:hypothetical protein